jgi:hypothetical protein
MTGSEWQRAEERAANRIEKITKLRSLIAGSGSPMRQKYEAELEGAEKAQRAYEEERSGAHVNPKVLQPVVSTFLPFLRHRQTPRPPNLLMSARSPRPPRRPF